MNTDSVVKRSLSRGFGCIALIALVLSIVFVPSPANSAPKGGKKPSGHKKTHHAASPAKKSASSRILHQGIAIDFSRLIIDSKRDTRCSVEVSYPDGEHSRAQHFTLSDPPRLVLDVEGLRIKGTKKFPLSPANDCVAAVRFGVHPNSTRIVFDLKNDANLVYDVAQHRSNLVFLLRETSGEGSAAPAVSPEVSPVALPEASPTAGATPEAIAPTPTIVSTVAVNVAEEQSPTVVSIEPVMPTATATQQVEELVTLDPTIVPTEVPTVISTEIPTAIPTGVPTVSPTVEPVNTAVEAASSAEAEATEAAIESSSPEGAGTETDIEALEANAPDKIIHYEVRPDLKFKVDQVLVELGAASPAVKNFTVTNVSGQTLHMTARVVEIKNPGTEEEEEIKTDKVLVSPLLFDLPSGEMRRVRLVGVAAPSNQEQVFRVHLVPLQDDFDTTINLRMQGVAARLNVVTALAITVLRAPTEAKALLKESREGDMVTLENVGNQHIALSEIRLCGLTGESGCRDLPNRRIFPGNLWRFELPKSTRIEMLQQLGTDFQPLRLEGAQ